MSDESNPTKEEEVTEEVSDEIADLEEYARKGIKPPLCRGYRVKINGQLYIFGSSQVTGREVLVKANLTPPENYTLRVKIGGQRPKKVELDETVDLCHPGIEKFKALPRDQIEGETIPLRRQFPLFPSDEAFLNDYGLPWETVIDGSQWLLIHDFPLPAGYNHTTVTAAIRMETGYPNAQLDMVYFSPALARQDGVPIAQTNATQAIHGNIFQRWSRHRTTQNPWKPDVDNLESHVILIEDWLEREFVK
ncbi:MAG: multiubiquitin domain-containing protein [Candidatus Nitrospinota bacterium M3_3B_026]